MTTYYNENEPYAAQWLRNLIAAGHIAPGLVDERSIIDVEPSDLKDFKQCHFFAGIGVWSHALRKAGWSDDRPVWTGSCPCQPFSTAGKREGFSDSRHLWPVWSNLISKQRPDVVFGEQVSGRDGRAWWDTVASDLENMDYAAGALDTCAAGVGAPHIRQRLYWMAHTGSQRLQGQRILQKPQREEVLEAPRRGEVVAGFWESSDWARGSDGKMRPFEPGTFPLAHGPVTRVGRLRAYGNALNAEQATTFVKVAMEYRP